MTFDPPVSKQDQPEEPRKDYTTPQLVHYGSIRDITRATGGTMGMNDGGAGKDKTG